MRTPFATAAAAAVLILLACGCDAKDDANASAPGAGTTTTSSADPDTPTPEPLPESQTTAPESGTGTPSTSTGGRDIADPCRLLAPNIAEMALGLAVGQPTTTPGEGNVTCSYAPADGRANVFVLLTTYAASGERALEEATRAFPDAQPVTGLGDAAYVSPAGHAIGVSDGDLLFGMSLLTVSGLEQPPAKTVEELVAVARAVLEAR